MFDILNKTITQYEGQLDLLTKEQSTLEIQISKREKRLSAIEEAQIFFQTVAADTQNKLRYHIQDIVQSALDTCFPNIYDFIIEFEIKRGQTEAKMYLEKDNNPMDARDSTGGGVVDIVAFALRIMTWTLSSTDNVLILDEPFKDLSKDLHPLAGEIMQNLCDKLNLQIIMVSHESDIINSANRVFSVHIRKKKSFITIEK